MRERALLFCQHLLGIGHYVRSMRVANALTENGFEVAFISGGMPVEHLRPDVARFEQLPPVRALDETFACYVDRDGAPLKQPTQKARRAQLQSIYDVFDPDLLVIEAFPFGRRILRYELLPLIEHARRANRLIACSLRDILVPRLPERERETVDLINRFFDLVLVHGDPTMARLEDSFGPARDLVDKVRYTGYVAPPPNAKPRATDEVLVSAGGGIVGRRLLDMAIAAKPLTTLDAQTWRLVAGQALPEQELTALHTHTDPGVVVERVLPDLSSRLHGCRLSISQAGYNTVVEILAANVPAVCVPFATETETEQTMRCDKLYRRGLIDTVPSDGPPEQLAAAADRAVLRARGPGPRVDLRGAETSARILREALRR